MTDSTLTSLLRACVAAPADAAPRLALADHLEEEGRLDAGRAAVLRDGRGEWVLGPHAEARWAFRDWSEQVLVGAVPADCWPRCARCATTSSLRHLGGLWLCPLCGFGTRGSANLIHAQADGPVRIGDPVTFTTDGRVRRATAADTIVGFAMRSTAHGRAVIRLG